MWLKHNLRRRLLSVGNTQSAESFGAQTGALANGDE